MRPAHSYVLRDPAAAGERAAELADAAIRIQPEIVLALPTGSTPLPMYAALVRLHRENGTDWSQVTTFNLDEYVGIGSDHPESYALYMETSLFHGVNLSLERRHLPDGMAPDPHHEAARYEAAIDRAHGIDLAVVGVGVNGHLGFNEPATALSGVTHVADLAPETWLRNFPNMADGAPGVGGAPLPFRTALTMGIGTILRARRIMLLATGETKSEIVRQALTGPITTQNPASLLQLHHDVTVILDSAAAG
ncbi:MAG TPA: glucosamine-6-phosphate deaminase [Chloroflexota bacterium]|nr:glucosamine-6-phosphate deaminase [Chloroflexota bacterium]